MLKRYDEKKKYICLDFVRGLAALEVTAGHLKNFLLDGINQESNIFWKLFNVLTGQGHAAVMVFFVMSGYLVGKHVHQSFNDSRWSWIEYVVKRLSRLWIVLIPALILTAVWDQIGQHAFHGPLYSGYLGNGPQYGGSLPGIEDAKSIFGFNIFLGNAFFLQGIIVPPFGINGPLWSLANEFWYYVIFPLAVFTVRGKGVISRTASAALTIGLYLFIPSSVRIYGIIWLFGFCLVLGERHCYLKSNKTTIFKLSVSSTLIFLSTLFVLPRVVQIDGTAFDFAVGVTFSILLLFLTKIELPDGLFSRGSSVLAGFSYTLYLTHFPFLALLLCAIFGNRTIHVGVRALAIYVCILFVTILYAFVIYCLFERNTKFLQTFLLKRVSPSARMRSLLSVGR